MGEKIIVLGGGIIGLSIAYECRRRNYEVTVLEKTTCGGQASGAAAGMLAPFSEIGEDPDDFFRLCLASLQLYPTWQEELKEISRYDFEYRKTGALYGIYHEADLLMLESRRRWQNEFGAKAEIVSGAELKKLERELSDEIIAAIYYPEESHVYTPDYVKALEIACRKLGVDIFEQLEDVNITKWQDDVLLTSKDGQTFRGDRLVIANGAWTSELEETFAINIPVFPIRGQICAYEIATSKIEHLLFTSQGYIVEKQNGTIVNGASEDIAGFDTTVTKKGIERLTNWNKHMLPFLEQMTPFHTWAGLRPATQDGYPLLGNLLAAEHVIFATGHYRNGILLSPVTGKVVADLIDGKQAMTPIDDFAPERFS